MDGFAYMSIVSRIEHYEQIARKVAGERRNAGEVEEKVAKLAVAGRPGEPVRLPEEKSA
jgi:hypothetical protein